jgi:hypothetical protein
MKLSVTIQSKRIIEEVIRGLDSHTSFVNN